MNSEAQLSVDKGHTLDEDLKSFRVAKVPTPSDLCEIQKSTVENLGEQLRNLGLSDETCSALEERKCNGESFFNLGVPKLRGIVPNEDERNRLLQIISRKTLEKSKTFLDPVHGLFKMHPLITKIIDTPELQRLRDIKQLGGVFKVYCGASHSRFEHSLGVCHLAGECGRILQRHQPEYMSDKDILCLEIAGLCHELGQGPFSRLFDQDVLQHVLKAEIECKSARGQKVVPPDDHSVSAQTAEPSKEIKRSENQEAKQTFNWVSKVSAEIFECLAERLKDDFEFYGLHPTHDVKFIKMLINPPKNEQEQKNALKQQFGRDGERLYYFQVVSNRRNEVDVDRFDYIARDSHHTGIKTGFDHRRLLMHMQIVEHNSNLVIGYRDKVAPNIYDMFQTRYQLYRSVYMHQPTMVIQSMIAKALKLVSGLKIFSKKTKKERRTSPGTQDTELSTGEWSINDAIADVIEAIQCDEMAVAQKAKKFKKFLKLSDSIYFKILRSSKECVQPARKLLKRLEKRKLFLLVGKTKPTEENERPWKSDEPESGCSVLKMEEIIADQILKNATTKQTNGHGLNKETLIVKIVSISYGVTDVHPLYGVTYYDKDNSKKKHVMVPDPPTTFKNRIHMHLRVFYAGESDKLLQSAQEAFRKFCKAKSIKDAKIPKYAMPIEEVEHPPTLVEDRNGSPTEREPTEIVALQG